MVDEAGSRNRLVSELAATRRRMAELEARLESGGLGGGVVSLVTGPGGESAPGSAGRDALERSYLESEARYQAMVEAFDGLIYVCSPDFRVEYMNRRLIERTGYDGTGGLCYRVLHDLDEVCSWCVNDRVFRGETVRWEVLSPKDGRWYQIVNTPIRRPDGRISKQALILDITEQKHAEEALRAGEERYRAIVEDQAELICRYMVDGTITFVNQACCRYFDIDRDAMLGRTFLLLILEEDRPGVRRLLRSLSADNPVATHELRVMAPDGEPRWMQWTIRLIAHEGSRPNEFQAVGRDVTSQKLLAEAHKKSAEQIKLFAYSVSHDLKGPAIGIYGLAKLLHKRCFDDLDEKGRRYCDQILTTSGQVAALVEKINLYIATKEAPLSIEPIKVKEVLRMVADEFATPLSIRRVKWSEPVSMPEIRADRLSILRALRNLVDNALKYGGARLSLIRIGYDQSGEFHVLSVSDDGVGVKGEDSKKIFGLFQRQKTSRQVEGAGLGLAIVKEIAAQHGGELWMESDPKKLTTFYISIDKSL